MIDLSKLNFLHSIEATSSKIVGLSAKHSNHKRKSTMGIS